MNEIINEEQIKNKIYNIRGKEVMLDSDLAEIYGCTNGTKTINQAMKRNKEKFPIDFCFQLTEDEYNLICSRSQIGTLNKSGNNRGSNIKYLPYVYTEHGVTMLSSVLRTTNAVKVSVSIVRAFVSMRHFIIDNQDIFQNLVNMNNEILENKKEILNNKQRILEQNEKIELLLNDFSTKENKEYIFFDGQIYDSYSKIIEIMNKSKKELIIIDNYADKSVLDIISKIKVSTILVTKPINSLSKIDVEKYNKQYNNLKIIYSNIFHDRFIIIDNNIIYHLGASINHAGRRIFAINKLEDKELNKMLIERLDLLK